MPDSHALPPRLQAILDALPLAELAFAPVPVRARHDGWTPARQTGFIHRLALCGLVGTSARAVGMTRKSAYRLRERPGAAGFAAAWDRAQGWGRQSRLDHALSRAVAGEVRPYYYRGRKCGEHIVFSEGLTIAVINLMASENERGGKERWPRREADELD